MSWWKLKILAEEINIKPHFLMIETVKKIDVRITSSFADFMR